MSSDSKSLEEQVAALRAIVETTEAENPRVDPIALAEWRGGITVLVEQLAKGQEALEGKVDNLVWKVAGIAATVSTLIALAQHLV